MTTYTGGSPEFRETPLKEMIEQIAAGRLHVKVSKVFRLDEIAEAHRFMEEVGGGKVVVLPQGVNARIHVTFCTYVLRPRTVPTKPEGKQV